MPGPIYIKHQDWKEVPGTQGKFGKYPKVSFTAEVLKKEKEGVPPNKYTVFHAKVNRPLGALKL